ncbi:MAG: hypothetical protein SF069_14685 [Phycisphaerae bacterium]|nr:hypothetical protein [Phycisphaerae bacterium]
MHFDGRCPECAAPVAASLHTVSPEFVDLVWLREIRGGSELAVFGFTLLMVSAVMVILFAPIAGVFFVVWLVGFVPISNWFLCAAPRGESRFDTVVRTFTRWSFAFATASLPLAGAVLPKSVAPIICAVIGLVWPLGCLGLAWVTSRIAERLPEYSHGSWTDGPLLLAIFWAIAAGTGAWGVLAPSLHDDDHFGLLLISAGFCLMFAVALFARIYCIGRAALELLGNNERLADPPIESEPAPASGSSSEASAATHVHVG